MQVSLESDGILLLPKYFQSESHIRLVNPGLTTATHVVRNGVLFGMSYHAYLGIRCCTIVGPQHVSNNSYKPLVAYFSKSRSFEMCPMLTDITSKPRPAIKITPSSKTNSINIVSPPKLHVESIYGQFGHRFTWEAGFMPSFKARTFCYAGN